MKWTLSALILFSVAAKSQVQIDTFQNAKAFASTYIPIYQYGVMANGHPYAVGLTLSQNPTFPYWITRTDLVTHQVTKKTLIGTISFGGGYWNSTFDSSGHLWIPINTDNYHVFEVDFKQDSIQVYDRGLPFVDENNNPVIALAYSIQLGTDGNIHVGAKGNPYIAYWDRLLGQWKHPLAGALNNVGIDWVLQVAGNKDYFYATSGQNDSCNAWAIRKSDGFKKNLYSTPNWTRPSVACNTLNGGYVTYSSNPADIHGYTFYRIDNGFDTVRVPFPDGLPPTYYEINNTGKPTVSSFFDAAKSKLFYILNGVSDSADIPTNYTQQPLALIITDRYNANRIYYTGYLYGTYYGYDIAKDSSWAIGNLGYNLYSWRRLNDSIIFLGVYPGGALVEWNLNKAWTAETYVNGVITHITDTNANPRIIYQFKNAASAFSHLSTFYIDTVNHLVVAAGDVIRVDSSASVGAYNYITKQGYGYDYHKIGKLSVSAIAQYGNKAIFSTATRFGQTPYLYIYNPLTNTMTDSITFAGFTDFGAIWINGDQLLGKAGTRFYKVNLSTKQLIYDKQGTATNVARLQDGKFVCNGGMCPPDWAECKMISNYTNFVGIGNGTYYSVSGNYLIRNRNLATETIDLNTAQGKEKYITNLLYNR